MAEQRPGPLAVGLPVSPSFSGNSNVPQMSHMGSGYSAAPPPGYAPTYAQQQSYPQQQPYPQQVYQQQQPQQQQLPYASAPSLSSSPSSSFQQYQPLPSPSSQGYQPISPSGGWQSPNGQMSPPPPYSPSSSLPASPSSPSLPNGLPISGGAMTCYSCKRQFEFPRGSAQVGCPFCGMVNAVPNQTPVPYGAPVPVQAPIVALAPAVAAPVMVTPVVPAANRVRTPLAQIKKGDIIDSSLYPTLEEKRWITPCFEMPEWLYKWKVSSVFCIAWFVAIWDAALLYGPWGCIIMGFQTLLIFAIVLPSNTQCCCRVGHPDIFLEIPFVCFCAKGNTKLWIDGEPPEKNHFFKRSRAKHQILEVQSVTRSFKMVLNVFFIIFLVVDVAAMVIDLKQNPFNAHYGITCTLLVLIAFGEILFFFGFISVKFDQPRASQELMEAKLIAKYGEMGKWEKFFNGRNV